MKKIDVLGVEFHSTTLTEAVALGKTWLLGQESHRVVTPNPEFILLAQKDEVFRQSLQTADLVVPDGIGVIYASKILGTALQERVPGIDFASGMLSELNACGGSLYLLGAKDGVAKEAGENLQTQYPKLKIAGCHHGYFSAQEEEAVAKKIAEEKPDMLFVCLGAPRQELFLERYGEAMGIKIGIGLGGALDVFAGRVDRAPEIWQKCNCEWLYRLCKEPKRFGRMMKLPLVLWQAFLLRCFGKK